MTIEGIVLVDKPSGPTSHDVVAKMRKIFNTRKVGHAGTLDPMATGMLVIGVGRATRLLGFFTSHEKEYLGTVCLGVSTTTDDSQGEILKVTSTAQLTQSMILETIREFRGPIMQQPSAVSAIKIDGRRAYARVRDGEEVVIPPRSVVIHDLEILKVSRNQESDTFDVELRVVCSAGTYIRALARDIGSNLGVGGHLTALRRTRSGVFDTMVPMAQLQEDPKYLDLSDSIRKAFPVVTLSLEDSSKARNGVRLPTPIDVESGNVGVFDSTGFAIGIFDNSDSELKPLVVFSSNEKL
jgi:tRNA pseudouridine55 synthase